MHRNTAADTDPSLPRGVYFGNHKVKGDRFVFAVDSRGDATKMIRLTASMTEDRAVRKLRAWLDEHDPVAQLTLVKAEPPYIPPPGCSRTYNTEPIEPVEASWRRIAQAGAARWRRFR